MEEAWASDLVGATRRKSSVALPFSRRQARRLLLAGTLRACDVTMLLAATSAASILRFDQVNQRVSFEHTTAEVTYLQVSLAVTVLWVASLSLERLYDLDRLFWGFGESARVLRGLTVGLAVLVLITYVLRVPGLSRAWTLMAWTFSVASVMGGRLAIQSAVRTLRSRGRMLRPTLIVGSNREAADLARMVPKDRGSGFDVVGCVSSAEGSGMSSFGGRPIRCLGSAEELREAVEKLGIESVIIASSAFDHDVVSRMIHELRGAPLDMHVSSGLFEVLRSRVIVREVAGIPLITVKGVSLSRGALLFKRVFDVAVASTLILLGVPLWAMLIALIRFTSRGPVFYRQQRIGQGGVGFTMLKFRSMYVDAEERQAELTVRNGATGPLFKVRRDPRVTPLGRWMRKLSIDELPQLLNVLKGEMSLIGPRPPLPHEVESYTDLHWRRLSVAPGMTGLWQVSGRSDLSFEEMVRLDLFYIGNWSVALDLFLLARTVPAVVSGRGAY